MNVCRSFGYTYKYYVYIYINIFPETLNVRPGLPNTPKVGRSMSKPKEQRNHTSIGLMPTPQTLKKTTAKPFKVNILGCMTSPSPLNSGCFSAFTCLMCVWRAPDSEVESSTRPVAWQRTSTHQLCFMAWRADCQRWRWRLPDLMSLVDEMCPNHGPCWCEVPSFSAKYRGHGEKFTCFLSLSTQGL